MRVIVHPVVFEPIYKPRIWGGRGLQRLGKTLPADESIGESWELVDLEDDQSVVRDGPAQGMTLRQLVETWGSDLLGDVPLFGGRFPLLIKFLDAVSDLSVQVHPDEARARQHGGDVRVKHEAWYVLDAQPDGAIYYGLAHNVDRAGFAKAVTAGKVVDLLKRVPVKAGQCYYLPSGTVHALGAGVMVAEIQTPSDTTFRVYDWDRVDAKTGKPRDLHIEDALECINFDTPIPKQERSHVVSVWASVTRLVTCEPFLIERIRMQEGAEQEIPYDGLVVWVVLQGKGQIEYPDRPEPLLFQAGDTVLLPAALKAAQLKITEQAMWLEVTVPLPSDLAPFERPSQAELRGQHPSMVQIIPPNQRDHPE